MSGNKHSTPRDWVDPDDAPDLSGEPWASRLAKTPARRGRPAVERPKLSTTIRLDAEVVEYFRAAGAGWQSRINAALREWVARNR